ncbi:MAG: cell surface protein SprA [Cytophagales bacterium]|nr:cell surface protein SprA [Cytophagales bacterium]
MQNYQKKIITITGFALLFITVLAVASNQGIAVVNKVSKALAGKDSLTYYPKDRQGTSFENPSGNSPMKLPTPSNVNTQVELDSNMNYTVTETVGDSLDYRPPSEMTFQEFAEWQRKQMIRQYWKTKTKGSYNDSLDNPQPLVYEIKKNGKPVISIRPAGSVTIDLGGKWQRNNNPAIAVRNQQTGGFEFDQQISLNLDGTIGERLHINANWDTKATFDFDNNIKISYQGLERDILQDIEAGNVSFPLNNSLISGYQNLFGVKTQLRFGHLYVTSVFSQSRGKTETMVIRGGAQTKPFSIQASEYDDFRHYFLSHFFKKNFDAAFTTNATAPNSGFQVTRLEVYMTNSNTKTQNLRSMIAFTDLGENGTVRQTNGNVALDGYLSNTRLIQGVDSVRVSDNDANTLWSFLQSDTSFRDASNGDRFLETQGFSLGTDFEKINSARKLVEGKDYTFHKELGYLSLTSKLRNNEALAVAFEYTYQGRTYKVGEMTEDIGNLSEDQLVALKLLKPQSIQTSSPTWDLMMKNIYPLNTNGVSKTNFQLRVIYQDDRTGVDNPSLQEGEGIEAVPLVQLLNLDKLNQNGDFVSDGNFDFIDNATIETRKGRIIFPTIEPFGNHLERVFQERDGVNALRLTNSYGYPELYSKTPSDARQVTTKNKYFIKGSFESSSTTDIMLPGLNIAEGSVSITVGPNTLMEGADYTVNYQLGRIKMINQGVLASGQDITIRYEKADLFSFRTKSLVGTNLEYRFSEEFNVGATVLHMSERPSITRVNVGDEPIKNTQLGVNVNYRDDSRLLTRLVDKLPVIQTKAPSTVALRWEAAMLKPGHSSVIGEEGTSYLDDFEGAETPYDFTRSPIRWNIGSTPRRLGDQEFDYPDWLSDTLDYNYHRAKLNWYTIDFTFYRTGLRSEFTVDKIEENNYTRLITPQEIFRNRETQLQNAQENILNIAYYPSVRGPYNYNVNENELNENGQFINPENNWGAMTTDISFDTDFKNANIEFIEFWVMDPFDDEDLKEILPGDISQNFERGDMGGQLYFNLGDVSEDVIPDGSHAFENGLPDNVRETMWGKVTSEQYINGSFDPQKDRTTEDVGFDGLGNSEEQEQFAPFIDALANIPGMSQEAIQAFQNDPSSDDYGHFALDENDERHILERYYEFNGLENNSPINNGSDLTPSSKTIPDNEDLNDDKTLNIANNYFQYKLDLTPNQLNTANPYVTDVVDFTDDATGASTRWYQVRIPIRDTTNKVVGNISNFQTIKFLRMYMTGFKHPIVLRLAQFQLVGAQWRRYSGPLDGISPKYNTQQTDPNFTISTVNIEENSTGTEESSPYVLPPDVIRDIDQTTNVTRQLNEQSIQLCVTDLKDDDARGVFKNTAYDLLNYKRIKMFVHAHTTDPSTDDGDVYAFVRLGTDLTDNYYEVAVPLRMSDIASDDPLEVWPTDNEIDIALSDFIATKTERNVLGKDFANKHTRTVGKYLVSVRGNPDISAIRSMMLGIQNPRTTNDPSDKDVCVWFNEFRISGFDESIGWATTGSLDAQLADLGSVSFSGKYTSVGYGDLEQPIALRSRANSAQYGVSTNLNIDKLVSKKGVVSIPVYASYNKEIITPKYNPLDPDVELDDALDALERTGQTEKRKELEKVVTYEKTVRSINVTNLRKNPSKKALNTPIDLKNFSASAGYTEETRSGIGGTNTGGIGQNLESYKAETYNGGLTYNYNSKYKGYSPFAKSKALKSKYLKLIKDININPIPNTVTVRGDLNRRYVRTQLYNAELTTVGVTPTYEKSFTFDRNYAVSWNLTKSIRLNYTSTVNTIIDEPDGNRLGDDFITRQEYSDSVYTNLASFGRMKNYNQALTASYKLPINKFPWFNWINSDINYNTSYNWNAAALGLVDTEGNEYGNIISNNQKITLNGKLNLNKFYNKSKFVKKINNPRRKPKRKKNPKDTVKVREYKVLKGMARTLLLVRSINGRYTLTYNTTVPGFLPTPQFFGATQDNANAPSVPFIFGSQDLDAFKELGVSNDWFTQSTTQNNPIMQIRKEEISVRSTVEPFKSFKIQLNANYIENSTYSEIFRVDETGEYNVFSPVLGGSTNVSYMFLSTSFIGDNDDESSNLFRKFETNRAVIRDRLQTSNTGDGEYGLNSQQVLIPAFFAAYSGKDVNTVDLSRTPKIPLPNWRINYSGLSKIPSMKKIFSSFSINHSYKTSYEIGNFTSSLEYNDVDNTYNNSISSTDLQTNESNEYLPRYIIQQVVIKEKFSPVIGVNMRTKSKINMRINWNKSRELALYTGLAEMVEVQSSDITFGFGYTIKKGKKVLFVKRRGQDIILKNPLDIKVDMSIRDTKTVQRSLDGTDEVTAGNVNFQLRPNINYQINRRLNAQLFFERTFNEPRVPSSLRRSSTAFGIKIRFNLS